MKVAALDLGSNSFNCLIVEGRAGVIDAVLFDQVRIVRLGQDLGRTGKFHVDALVRARDCLIEFKTEIDKHSVDHVLAMATSAARDATNQDELFAICQELNIPLEIISGSDEARITYSGAVVGESDSGQTN
ncbi:MAG: Ppx/GppA family phosphatase, partial [Proteobacteria bacterium]